MFERLSQARRNESGFTLVELLVVMIIVGILAAVAIPVFTNQRAKASRNTAVTDGRAVAQEVSSMLMDYTNYGTGTAHNISVPSGSSTLTITMGTSPTPNVTSATSTVRISSGSVVTGNLPAGAQTVDRFCLRVTNNSQVAVYTEAGYQQSATTCTAGVAS